MMLTHELVCDRNERTLWSWSDSFAMSLHLFLQMHYRRTSDAVRYAASGCFHYFISRGSQATRYIVRVAPSLIRTARTLFAVICLYGRMGESQITHVRVGIRNVYPMSFHYSIMYDDAPTLSSAAFVDAGQDVAHHQ